MKKTVLTFGLISGALSSLMMVATVPFAHRIGFNKALIVGYTTIVLSFLLVYFGIRSYRDNASNGHTERTKKMNSENIKKVTNQAIEQLVEALNAGHSEALTRYLAAMAKFRAYSFLNVLLILEQCPNAGRVAGYRTWQSFGRQVKQGTKGIMILAPMFRKRTETSDESNTTDESRKVAGFRPVYMWDEHQTSGKELPQIGSVTGDPSFYLERLEEFVRASGIRLDYLADIAPVRGMAEKGKITLLPEQTLAETLLRWSMNWRIYVVLSVMWCSGLGPMIVRERAFAGTT